jgi:UDP-N-acetylglucosamine 2-epimerase
VPCTTLREETEWVETVELGWNVIAGHDRDRALATLDLPVPRTPTPNPYGNGTAGDQIAAAAAEWLAGPK